VRPEGTQAVPEIIREVPGSEHHVTLDNPTGFIEVVKAFLAK